MRYISQSVQPQAIARFGQLKTAKGIVNLPAVTPGIRTKTDALALLKNIDSNLNVSVITPFISAKRTIMPHLQSLYGQSHLFDVKMVKPLVIPDIESEALSMNCTARQRFLQKGNLTLPGKTVSPLFSTGLKNYFSVWKAMDNRFGL